MGILTGPEIERLLAAGDHVDAQGVRRWLDIQPRPAVIGPNSADLTLGPTVLVVLPGPDGVIDTRRPVESDEYPIPAEGLVLNPGVFVLGSTVERTRTIGFVPWLDGRSTTARFGLMVHLSAGKGDNGFDGPWTLEICNLNRSPVRIYAGQRIAQVSYLTTVGEQRLYAGHYAGQDGPTPPVRL